jgi:hypothetical protein
MANWRLTNSPFGRPSIDPVLMIRMLIIGYVFAIRSERALCRELQVNLAYRWLCGLGIEDKIPDHSAFSRARNEPAWPSQVAWPHGAQDEFTLGAIAPSPV